MSAQYITPNKVKNTLQEVFWMFSWFQLAASGSPSSSSSSPYTPMSERQQLAMIKQMTEMSCTPDKDKSGKKIRHSVTRLFAHNG